MACTSSDAESRSIAWDALHMENPGLKLRSLLMLALGMILGAVLTFAAALLIVWQGHRAEIESAPRLLRLQFSSEGLSSEELAFVIERGYRAKMWDQLADFFETRPSYETTIEILGPPDAEFRGDEFARSRGLDHLPKVPGRR